MAMIFGLSIAHLLGCAPTTGMKTSDHFNGRKFHNPTMAEEYSPGFSDVFRMMREGRPDWPEHVENVGVPRLNENLGPGDVALTFVNHATFLIQFPGLNILTDPVWADRVGPISWLGLRRVRAPGVKLEDLPRIDLIVISHNHYDHLDVETLTRLNERFAPKVLVPLGDSALVESLGFKDVQALDWWESVEIGPDTRITFTPTQHSSRRGLFDLDKSLWGSYFIRHGTRSVFFGGDAGYSTHYAAIQKRLGAPEVALLSIGDYLPGWFMEPIHMRPAEAVAAHKDLGAKLSIAMHFETFQNSAVTFEQPLDELREATKEGVLSQGKFIALEVGETIIRAEGDWDDRLVTAP